MQPSPLTGHVMLHLGPIPVAEAVLVTWAMMAILVGAGVWLKSRLRMQPSRWQSGLELLVETVDQQIRDTMQAEPRRYRGFIGTLFVYIFFANWCTLIPGIEPPTARPETDMALASLVFVAVVVFGVRAGGWRGYLASFAKPNPLMIPLNFVESLTRTFSLFVRLFGNVMAGVFIIGIVLSLAGLLVPIPLMALDLLTGAVQAYIFAVLAMVFIGAAVGDAGQPNKHDVSIPHATSRSRT